MACAHPWKRLVTVNRPRRFGTISYEQTVPCGKCLNCVVDRRNSLEDLCHEELQNFHNAVSYVTVTYDDIHVPRKPDWTGEKLCVFTLQRSDVKDFLKRIRSYMHYHKMDSILTDPKFKYVCVGEYGEKNKAMPRPHYHFVFFGLDYRAAAKMFRECWQLGMVKVLPVKRGCFRYVLDYLDKQLHQGDPFATYNATNRARPFMVHSRKLGWSLFYRNWKFITSHNWCYKTKHNRLRPVPSYVKRYFGADNYKLLDWYRNPDIAFHQSEYQNFQVKQNFSNPLFSNDVIFFRQFGITHLMAPVDYGSQAKQSWIDRGKKLSNFSFSEYNVMRHQLAVEREASLARRLRANGRATDYGFTTDTMDLQLPDYNDDWSVQALDNDYIAPPSEKIGYNISHVSTLFGLLPDKSASNYNSCRASLRAALDYVRDTKNIHYHDENGNFWCYDGQQDMYPSYKDFWSVCADYAKYGDVVGF